METTKEKQELHCHNCNNYVQFEIDLALNGNHILECPNCGHKHYRVVRNGQITSERWNSGNPIYTIASRSMTTSTTSTYNTSTSGSYWTYRAWSNSTTTG